MLIDFDFYSKKDLITRVRQPSRPVAFLVGSPLSVDDGGGVPGVASMIELIRDDIRANTGDRLGDFENTIHGKSGGDAYRAAMRWLKGNRGPEGVNRVVQAAVLRARTAGAAADFKVDGDACDWYIPAGTKQLAELVCRHRDTFPGPILTTNFDPLLFLAIDSCGGRPRKRVIKSDGRLEEFTREYAGEIQIVYLHGLWRDSSTLHTLSQLTSSRPELKYSLRQILKKHTLIVVAYGGWDDVFADALVEAARDDEDGIDILWCFRETNYEEIKRNYQPLLERVLSAITRGDFNAYGDINCHTIFGEIAAALSASPTSVAPGVAVETRLSPIAGWQLIDRPFLDSLQPLTPEEVVRYFDGAVPNWRHAVSDAIPRREDVAKILSRVGKAREAERADCTLQLIRAAGGEGKSTMLLQAAAAAARAGGWEVLWRTSPTEGLPPQHASSLDQSRRWLVVADDADNIVRDIAESARLLNGKGRSNVYFLLAARDADWKNAGGDEQLWGEWLTPEKEIELHGITPNEAWEVVLAWEKYEKVNGLRGLAGLGDTRRRADALRAAVSDSANDQPGQRKLVDGSFFGGLLAVRFGQQGLQAHVRDFLSRLKVPIQGGKGNLSDALVYIAACHGVGIPGIYDKVLADLVGVPREWVQSRVVLPLGREAAAVGSAGHVFTRHSRVAVAILLEAEKALGLKLSEVWARLVSRTAEVGKEPGSHVGPTFAPITQAGPNLMRDLPQQLPADTRKATALAAALADVDAEPNRLGAIIALGKTYRNVGDPGEAVALFRKHVSDPPKKYKDYARQIRAFWYEWSVCEGARGKDRQHALADAWLGGLSVSDHLNPAPIDNERAKMSCAGLAVAFGKLAQNSPACPYAKGRRAAAFLRRLTNPDPATAHYSGLYDHEADKLKTPHPADVTEALSWIAAGVASAGGEIEDQFLLSLAEPGEVLFGAFFTYFVNAQSSKSDTPPPRKIDRIVELRRRK